MKEPLIMDEQDKINDLKAQIRAKSEAILRLKREANKLLKNKDLVYGWACIKEREALRKVLGD